MRVSELFVLALGLVGCGGHAPLSGVERIGATPSAHVPSRRTDPAAPFDVHEWGVIQVSLGGASILEAGPGRRRPGPSLWSTSDEDYDGLLTDKPVLYLHLDEGTEPFDVHVAAALRGGRVTEHWPDTSREGGGVAWSGMVRACPSEVDWPTDAVCDVRVDPVCERRELRAYATADAACLETSTAVAGLLFYRGVLPPSAMPLSIEGEPASLRVRGRAPSTVLFTRERRGGVVTWADGTDVAPLPVGEGPLAGGELNALLADELRRGGLTEPEVDAFMRAWSEELFDTPWALVRRNLLISSPPPSLIYVLPEEIVDELVPLVIEPPPRALRRVFVVRVHLPSTA